MQDGVERRDQPIGREIVTELAGALDAGDEVVHPRFQVARMRLAHHGRGQCLLGRDQEAS